eukprot:3257434-Rhodomonas_salina.2
MRCGPLLLSLGRGYSLRRIQLQGGRRWLCCRLYYYLSRPRSRSHPAVVCSTAACMLCGRRTEDEALCRSGSRVALEGRERRNAENLLSRVEEEEAKHALLKAPSLHWYALSQFSNSTQTHTTATSHTRSCPRSALTVPAASG